MEQPPPPSAADASRTLTANPSGSRSVTDREAVPTLASGPPSDVQQGIARLPLMRRDDVAPVHAAAVHKLRWAICIDG